jgi:phage terminase small subunit
MSMALNDRKRAFCEEYLKTYGNATKSAIKAGYSEKTASSAGHKLKNDPECIGYIDQLKKNFTGDPDMVFIEVFQKMRYNLHNAEKESDQNTAGKVINDMFGFNKKNLNISGEITNKYAELKDATEEELDEELKLMELLCADEVYDDVDESDPEEDGDES